MGVTTLIYRIAIPLLLMVMGGFPDSAAEAAGTREAQALIERQYQQRHSEFAAEMDQLADGIEEGLFPDVSEAIRRLAATPDEQTLDIDVLPGHVQSELPASLSDAERQWRAQLQRIRSDYAQDLYRLSRRALNADLVSFAFHLVREVAFHDPDHRLARQLLGFVQHEDRWVTPFEQSMLRKGNVWHERYGWLPHSHVERYERGERYFRGRWMTASQEAAQPHDFKNAWEIESDHFLILTNQSLERGVELSVALEKFHRFFRREFAAVFDSPQQMQQLFDSGKAGGRGGQQRHTIHYYQSREEFVFRLRDKQAGIEVSNGLYLPSERTAYFFYDPDDLESNEETLFHEVTHQLLSESQRKILDVGREANFWLIEGIACYLESFEIDKDGAVSVGDPRHVRMHWARQRRLADNFYVPLNQFVRLGMTDFQQLQDQETLRKYYSQATGLTHFFLHYEDGLYRDVLIDHLAQIYSPDSRVRTNPRSLDKLIGVPFSELDRQYLGYLTEMQAALEGAGLPLNNRAGS